MKKVCAALRSMHDTSGLIIDLRGNHGGLLGMIAGLSGLLETAPLLIGSMQTGKAQVQCSLSAAFGLHGRAGPLSRQHISIRGRDIRCQSSGKWPRPGRRRGQRGQCDPIRDYQVADWRSVQYGLQSIGPRKERCWKPAE